MHLIQVHSHFNPPTKNKLCPCSWLKYLSRAAVWKINILHIFLKAIEGVQMHASPVHACPLTDWKLLAVFWWPERDLVKQAAGGFNVWLLQMQREFLCFGSPTGKREPLSNVSAAVCSNVWWCICVCHLMAQGYEAIQQFFLSAVSVTGVFCETDLFNLLLTVTSKRVKSYFSAVHFKTMFLSLFV